MSVIAEIADVTVERVAATLSWVSFSRADSDEAVMAWKDSRLDLCSATSCSGVENMITPVQGNKGN